MSSFSITFSSDSSQETLLSTLTQQLKTITNLPASAHATEAAPPSMAELAAVHGKAVSGATMAGAPPSLQELESVHGKAGSCAKMAGAPPSPAEMEADRGKHAK